MVSNRNQNDSAKYLKGRIEIFMKSFLRKNRYAMRYKKNPSEKNNEVAEINKWGNGVKWTDVAMVLITAILAYFTWQLFNIATIQSDAGIKAANAAVTADSISIQALKLSQIQFKTSLQNAEEDKIEQSKRSAEDAIERRKQFELDSTSTQAQIDALIESQRQFEYGNRPFVVLTNIRIDTNFVNNVLNVTYFVVNQGKLPGKILNAVTYIAMGVDTLHFDRITDKTYVLTNEYIAASALLFGHTFMGNIPELYKYQIKKGIEKVFLFTKIEYQTFGTKKSYIGDFIYQITYSPYISTTIIKD